VASTTLSTSLCFCAALGRKRKHRDTRLTTDQNFNESAEANAISASSAAVGSITTPQSAKIQCTIMTDLTVAHSHKKKAGDQFEPGTYPDALKRRANRM